MKRSFKWTGLHQVSLADYAQILRIFRRGSVGRDFEMCKVSGLIEGADPDLDQTVVSGKILLLFIIIICVRLLILWVWTDLDLLNTKNNF